MFPGVEVAAADLPAWLVRVTAFVFAALWGSFFNVAIYRWPRGMSVVSPPSHCPHCGADVPWYRNIPIVGFLLLRGKAGCCGAPLTSRYVWVELLSAVLGLAVAERFFVRAPAGASVVSAGIETLLYFAFVGGLVIATFVDLEWMEIPDEVSLPGAALGLSTVALREAPGPVEAAVGAGLGFLVVQVLFVWGYELLTGRRGMGEGDAKLLMMIGAFLGWHAILFVLVAGSVQGLFAYGLATLFGVPLVPERPDGEDLSAALHGAPPAPEPEAEAHADAHAEDEGPDPHAASGPSMMVFGPMLALSALEYLFLGDWIVARVTEWMGS